MHPASCNETHHHVTDLVIHGMVKNTKAWIYWEWNITFLRNKNDLWNNLRNKLRNDLCLRWPILRSYCFVARQTLAHKTQWQFFQMAKGKLNYVRAANFSLLVSYRGQSTSFGVEIKAMMIQKGNVRSF